MGLLLIILAAIAIIGGVLELLAHAWVLGIVLIVIGLVLAMFSNRFPRSAI